jgi:hypothetical protein
MLEGVISATMSNHGSVADTRGQTMACSAECGGVADRDGKPVLDDMVHNPASNSGCGGVADRIPLAEGSGMADISDADDFDEVII